MGLYTRRRDDFVGGSPCDDGVIDVSVNGAELGLGEVFLEEDEVHCDSDLVE